MAPSMKITTTGGQHCRPPRKSHSWNACAVVHGLLRRETAVDNYYFLFLNRQRPITRPVLSSVIVAVSRWRHRLWGLLGLPPEVSCAACPPRRRPSPSLRLESLPSNFRPPRTTVRLVHRVATVDVHQPTFPVLLLPAALLGPWLHRVRLSKMASRPAAPCAPGSRPHTAVGTVMAPKCSTRTDSGTEVAMSWTSLRWRTSSGNWTWSTSSQMRTDRWCCRRTKTACRTKGSWRQCLAVGIRKWC